MITCSPCIEMRERIGKVKMRKLVGGDEDSLMGKAKSMHAGKAKERMNSPSPMGREMLSCPQEIWALSHLSVAWQEKHCHSEHPHFLLHPAVFGDYGILWCGTVSLGIGRFFKTVMAVHVDAPSEDESE